MKKILMICSFLVPLFPLNILEGRDFFQGTHNPNGKTGLITIRLPFEQNITDSNKEQYLAISLPLTDYFTLQYNQTRSSSKTLYTWTSNSSVSSVDIYLHLPLYRIWE